ncbi:hypothetical protein ACT4ZD_03520 [Acinetobacter baumannii]
MLNLITGVPGTCKTAYVVTELDKVERENKLNLQKNKSIYLHNRPIFKKYRNDFSYFEVESGSGHELKTDLELLSDDYFDFLNEDYDDLRPDFIFYVQRVITKLLNVFMIVMASKALSYFNQCEQFTQTSNL